MNKHISKFLDDLCEIKNDYWLMLANLFLMKIGQFMLLPFLAIYLAKHTHLSPAIIGITVGSGPFIYGIVSLIAGVLVDHFGTKKAMLGSLFISSISLVFFFYFNALAWFFLMNVITGVTRSFFDIGSKSYGVAQFSPELRKISFSLRFMAVNTAAAIGPVLGAYFANSNTLFGFKVIGILYAFLGILGIFFMKDSNEQVVINKQKKATLFELIKICYKDYNLQLLLLVSFFFWIVYSQLDTTLAQYLNAALPNGVKVYSLLLIINAVGCASLQMLITQLTKDIDEKFLSFFAMIFFAIANLIIAFFLNIYALVTAAIIIVLAETTIMPLNDFILARIAPPERIGTYYGVTSFAMLGLGIGPMFGGIVYNYYGASVLFAICCVICILAIFLYKKMFGLINAAEHKVASSV